MEVGQVGFHDEKLVRKVHVAAKMNEVVNRLTKTREVRGGRGGECMQRLCVRGLRPVGPERRARGVRRGGEVGAAGS